MGVKKIRLILKSKAVLISIPFILMATPVLIYFWYIHTYGVNVLFWDDWGILLLLDKFHSGNLFLSDLFAQHNEHRVFFPKIVFLFIGNLTDINSVSNMYFSALILVFTLMIFFISWIRYSGFNERSLWKFVPVPYLLFSLLQYENTLWGFQISLYMVLLFVVLSFYLLENGLLIPALISAILASFSSLQGLLVWPVGAIFFLINRKFETKGIWRKNALIWAISGLTTLYFYFIDYQKPASHPSMGFAFLHPVDGVAYFLTIISNVMVPTPRFMGNFWAIFFGSIIFILYILFIKKTLSLKDASRFYFPLSLMSFCLLFDIVTTFGRSGFGVEQAFSPRYTTYNLTGLIGLYLSMLVIMNYEKVSSMRDKFIPILMAGIILLSVIVSIPVGLIRGEDIKIQRTEAKNLLSNIDNVSDNSIEKYLYPDSASLRNFVTILHRNSDR